MSDPLSNTGICHRCYPLAEGLATIIAMALVLAAAVGLGVWLR